jgi:hypothetical protein
MKRGSLIRANHELETHCKRTRDLRVVGIGGKVFWD